MEKVLLSEIGDEAVRTLIKISDEAREQAYNPYSKFAVGAALRCEDNSVVTGCNVENVSFGLTICAERTAIVKSVSEGKRKFTSIAVSAINKDFLVSPCGACRQVLAEFNPNMTIYLYNPATGVIGVTNLQYLLPAAVTPDNMNEVLNIG